MLCQDLDLSPFRFVQPIADSIRSQVLDFESFSQVQLPSEHTRVIINVNYTVSTTPLLGTNHCIIVRLTDW
jgi:hypothetical protein